MGWGNIRRPVRRARSSWTDADLNTAAAVCAAQLPAAGLVRWIDVELGDDHGIGYGGAFALLCPLLFAPVLLPLLGLLHAAVHIAPAAVLARLVPGRGPDWVRHLACAVALCLVLAALPAVLWGWPYGTTALVPVALSVLPVLGVAYVRRARVTGRQWGSRDLWFRCAMVSFGLCVLVVVGGVLATVTGVVREYEPPVLSSGQLTGVWRGEQGAVLRLLPGGRAQLADLPAEPELEAESAEDIAVCDGTGTWSLTRENPAGWVEERDGVALILDAGCGRDTFWTIGGSERDPELFVLFGDPDAGDLHILKRD
ncbi:hypothetical protein AB0L99_13815 [Streptomyces sp. NPDC051954]|uniref:hypothetical protein n=1 Tax=unclassified Streptomyces TaxID=2593676 RepID=UPI0034285000